jgi:hypothetical protein
VFEDLNTTTPESPSSDRPPTPLTTIPGVKPRHQPTDEFELTEIDPAEAPGAFAAAQERLEGFLKGTRDQIDLDHRKLVPTALTETERSHLGGNWEVVAAEEYVPPAIKPPPWWRTAVLSSPLTRWMILPTGEFQTALVSGLAVALMLLPGAWWALSRASTKQPAPESHRARNDQDWDSITPAWAVAQKFLVLDGVGAKASVVCHPGETTPHMTEWYRNHDASSERNATFFTAEVEEWGVSLYVYVSLRERPTLFVMERQPEGGYLVDWEATVGWPDSAKIPEIGSGKPVITNAIIERADYYNYDFSDANKDRSLCFTLPGLEDTTHFAYVERGSEMETLLAKRLNEVPFLTIRVQADPGPEVAVRKQWRLGRIIAPAWHIRPQADHAPQLPTAPPAK